MTADTSREPRWRRRGPDERHADILDAAVRAFGEQPYAAVQMAAIAKDAGVTRALVHHYVGTKRDLYLEVVRALRFVPPLEEVHLPSGSLRERVEALVAWLVTAMGAHARTWVAVGADGVADAEVRAILDEADDQAAARVLDSIGFAGADRETATAVVRAYGGLIKAAMREWVERDQLTEAQVRTVLTETLVALAESVLPRL
ncbi:TetR/AcrR family transcriptional regulator [Nocardia thailandica]|uniref:TetR/AcrR family transcriptional regulator n=1 Tax=Nocardia thailandica TaxID=257275 RepID=A0ABW6PWF0_9NOCA|nr:TetR/AcrR family transcriptional regulator [Nocardia thailandica]